MPFKKKQPKKNPIRIVRIPRLEWFTEDTAICKQFFSTNTFKKLKAVMDGYLVNNMVRHETSDDYRKGWVDCMSQLGLFAQVEDPQEDSAEMTSMQLDDN